MTAPAATSDLVPGPLTAGMVARAVVAAAAEYGFDPQTVFAPVRDGRGRVRLLAAAALIHPTDRPAIQCAKLLGVQVVQMSPSGLVGRGVYCEALARVRADLARAAAATSAADAPLTVSARRRRGDPDYVDPRRDMAREARMLNARRSGEGPRAIAKREGVSLTATKALFARIARETGEVFPEVPPGPHRGGRPRKAPPSAPGAASARPACPAKAQSGRKRGRPSKAAEPAGSAPRPAEAPAFAAAAPSEPVEPFPRSHPAWAPLPGTTPARLIDHKSGCRWPVTVEGSRDHMVCNARTIEAPGCGPYCGRHVWLSLGPAGRARLAAHAPAPVSQTPRMARPAGADELKDA